MGKPLQIIQTKDEISPAATPVAQIDQMLSDLSRLYLERFKAMREGDPSTVQALSARITDIKAILGQI